MRKKRNMPAVDHSEIDLLSISCSLRIFGKASFEAAVHGRAKNVGASPSGTFHFFRPCNVSTV
jgi:hypothetical protein